MKREIKFRAKRIDNGEWIHGNFVYMHGSTGGWTTGIQMRSGDGYRAWASINVDPKTVGQYTGVHDDSEEPQELYDTDIVEVEYEGHKHVCKVQYCGSGYILVADSFTDGFLWLSEIVNFDGIFCWAEGTKKIGNIYDNPDLLEG